jgi:hypothetical protein
MLGEKFDFINIVGKCTNVKHTQGLLITNCSCNYRLVGLGGSHSGGYEEYHLLGYNAV